MTVSVVSLDESGSNFAIVAATSLLLDVTRGSSEAYTEKQAERFHPSDPDSEGCAHHNDYHIRREEKYVS